ncbi:hypothetical protein QOT17_004818 [Balamuthia mandrillaris]
MGVTDFFCTFYILFSVLTTAMVHAQTGYFTPDGRGVLDSCTNKEPCGNLTGALLLQEFEEYVLASGQYALESPILFFRPTTIRNWRELQMPGQPLISSTIFLPACFAIDAPQYLEDMVQLILQGVILECEGSTAIDLLALPMPARVELMDVTIRNSVNGLVASHDEPEAGRLGFNLFLSNFKVQQVNEASFGALHLMDVVLEFEGYLLFENNFNLQPLPLVTLNRVNATGHDGVLSFVRNDNGLGPLLFLSDSRFHSYDVSTEIIGNTNVGQTAQLIDSIWLSNARTVFQENTAVNLVQTLGSSTWTSVAEVINRDNLVDQMEFDCSLDSECCFTPCPDGSACDCPHLPSLSWQSVFIPPNEQQPVLEFPATQTTINVSVSSSIEIASDDQHVPFVLEMSHGLQHGVHFVVFCDVIVEEESSPTDPVLHFVLLLSRGSTVAQFQIERLEAASLGRKEYLTISPALSSSSAPFFIDPLNIEYFLSSSLSRNPLKVVFYPNARSYLPPEKGLALGFPSDRPDHVISLIDQIDNNALTVAFGSLMEVQVSSGKEEEDEKVIVVASASLTQIPFVAEQLVNFTDGSSITNGQTLISFLATIYQLEELTRNETTTITTLAQPIQLRFNFSMFLEETVVEFGGVEQAIQPNSIKWTLHIQSWPFQHSSNFLRLQLPFRSKDGPISLLQQEIVNGTTLVLVTNNTEIPFRTFPLAVVDGEEEAPVKALWQGGEDGSSVVLQLPWFSQSLLLDPDMSMLLRDRDGDENGDDEGEDGDLWWKITVPLLLVLAVLVVVAIILYIRFGRIRKNEYLRKRALTERIKSLNDD